MAKFAAKAGEEWAAKLSALGEQSGEVAKKALYEGAAVMAEEIKNGIAGLPQKTGATKRGLEAGFGITKMRQDGGVYEVKLGFDGCNENGKPNQLMARIMESGTSKTQKHPFVRPAVNRSKKAVQQAMQDKIDEECRRIMGR